MESYPKTGYTEPIVVNIVLALSKNRPENHEPVVYLSVSFHDSRLEMCICVYPSATFDVFFVTRV